MSLSRKHFQALADIIRDEATAAKNYMGDDQRSAGMVETCDSFKWAIAAFCAKHNPNFDQSRFLDACEPKPPKE